MDLILQIFVFLIGLCLGSFLNVVIYRLPMPGMSIFHPRRSACPACGNPITWYDNLPVISYAALLGRCRRCRKPISWRYPFVELVAGVLTLAVFHLNGFNFRFLVELYFVLALMAVTYIDLDHTIIPDSLTFPGMVLGLAGAIFAPDSILAGPWLQIKILEWSGSGLWPLWIFWLVLAWLFGGAVIWIFDRFCSLARDLDFPEESEEEEAGESEVIRLTSIIGEFFGRRVLIGWAVWIALTLGASILAVVIDPQRAVLWFRLPMVYNSWTASLVGSSAGLALGGGLVLAIYSIYLRLRGHEGMGLGDLTLLAMIGANLGWRAIYFSIFIGSITALVAYLITVLLGRNFDLKTALPFGPFLSLGALIFLFSSPGETILTWYLG